jgi:hypothetical protein
MPSSGGRFSQFQKDYLKQLIVECEVQRFTGATLNLFINIRAVIFLVHLSEDRDPFVHFNQVGHVKP